MLGHVTGTRYTTQDKLAQRVTVYTLNILETVTIQFEANTTHKSIGALFICDLNTEDSLDLIWQNQDKENVTVVTDDITDSRQRDYNGPRLPCAETNLKVCFVFLR